MTSSAFADYLVCQPAPTLLLRLRCRYLGVDNGKSAMGAAVRQHYAVIAYCGFNGSGKSAAAVYDCLPTLQGRRWSCRNTGHLHMHATGCTINPVTQNGCRCELRDVEPTSDYDGPLPAGAFTEGEYVVWSTTRLTEPDGSTHPRYRPLRTLNDLARVEHAELLLDEVPGIADARDHQSMPNQVRKAIQEMRRRDVIVRITSVGFESMDSRLRMIVRCVVQCAGLSVVRQPGSMWPESRVLRWTAYDRADFERFTQDARNRITPLGRQFVWRPGHLLERSYDTLAPVLALSIATESGACMVCGGARPRAACGCEVDAGGVEVLPGVREVEVEGPRGTKKRVRVVDAVREDHPVPA